MDYPNLYHILLFSELAFLCALAMTWRLYFLLVSACSDPACCLWAATLVWQTERGTYDLFGPVNGTLEQHI